MSTEQELAFARTVCDPDDFQWCPRNLVLGRLAIFEGRAVRHIIEIGRGGRIVCVGTTSLRLLETASDEEGRLQPWHGATDIFITPGYRFRYVDILMTNFHLPRSTLFMLVCAFSGIETMREAYRHAIENGYRFYSYGDAVLLFRRENP